MKVYDKKKILGIILGWNKKHFLVYYLCLKSFGNNKKELDELL